MATSNDFASNNLVGKNIDGWNVLRQVVPSTTPGGTGGVHSICYIVERDGVQYFMKVLDLFYIFQGKGSLAEKMQKASNEFQYEKKISKYCDNNNVTKVIRYVADGATQIEDFLLGEVEYIVFESAKCNIRDYLNFSAGLDLVAKVKTLSEKLESLRNVAVGLKQLHSAKVTHQDLKPSNIVSCHDGDTKICDLGSALCFDAEYKDNTRKVVTFNGDANYAPPEAIFGALVKCGQEEFYQMDNYTLGGIIAFYITGLSFNALMNKHLPLRMNYMAENIDMNESKDYLINAYQDALEDIRSMIPLVTVRDGLVNIVAYLCNPYPEKRGHPKNLTPGTRVSNYDLVRTVSELDLLRRKAEIELIRWHQ